MAKGDDSRARNAVNYQGNLAQNNLNNLRTDTLIPQNQTLWNNYTTANAQNQQDYGNIMQGFNAPMAGYANFAKTGGFSPTDISNIRAQSIAPIRGVYSNANREVNRSRALQGGYSPGFGTLQSRMARDMGTALSGATTDAEANIAKMIQSGKLAGLAGEGDIGSRMTSLYGATPGMTSLAQQGALESTNQRLQGENLQGNLSGDIMRNTIAAGQLPGKTQSTLGNIGGVLGLAGQVGGMIYPWLGAGGSALNSQVPGSYASNLYQSGGFGQPGVR